MRKVKGLCSGKPLLSLPVIVAMLMLGMLGTANAFLPLIPGTTTQQEVRQQIGLAEAYGPPGELSAKWIEQGLAGLTIWYDDDAVVESVRVRLENPIEVDIAPLLFNLRGPQKPIEGMPQENSEEGYTLSYLEDGVHFCVFEGKVEIIWLTARGQNPVKAKDDQAAERFFPPIDAELQHEPQNYTHGGEHPEVDPDMNELPARSGIDGSRDESAILVSGPVVLSPRRKLMIKRVWIDLSQAGQFVVCGDVQALGMAGRSLACTATIWPLGVPYQGVKPMGRMSLTLQSGHAFQNTLQVSIPRAALASLERNYFSLAVQMSVQCDGLSAWQNIQWIPYGKALPQMVAKTVHMTDVEIDYDRDNGRFTARADAKILGLLNQPLTLIITPMMNGQMILASPETPAHFRDSQGHVFCLYQDPAIPYNDSNMNGCHVFLPFSYLTVERGKTQRLVMRVGLFHKDCMSYCDQEIEVLMP